MLEPRHVELIENSWDFVLFNSQNVGFIFYKRLFEIDPHLRTMFSGDIKSQSQKLIDMITFVVHKLRNFDEIATDIKMLGVRHEKNSVKPEHYPIVGSTLLWTLEKVLGVKWNNEVREAWYTVYADLSKIMIEATEK